MLYGVKITENLTKRSIDIIATTESTRGHRKTQVISAIYARIVRSAKFVFRCIEAFIVQSYFSPSFVGHALHILVRGITVYTRHRECRNFVGFSETS